MRLDGRLCPSVSLTPPTGIANAAGKGSFCLCDGDRGPKREKATAAHEWRKSRIRIIRYLPSIPRLVKSNCSHLFPGYRWGPNPNIAKLKPLYQILKDPEFCSLHPLHTFAITAQVPFACSRCARPASPFRFSTTTTSCRLWRAAALRVARPLASECDGSSVPDRGSRHGTRSRSFLPGIAAIASGSLPHEPQSAHLGVTAARRTDPRSVP